MTALTAEQIAKKHNAGIGHNSTGAVPDGCAEFVDRLARLDEEKKTLAEDVRQLKAEAKDKGFDPKALAYLAKLKNEEPEAKRKRERFEDTVDAYLAAARMLS